MHTIRTNKCHKSFIYIFVYVTSLLLINITKNDDRYILSLQEELLRSCESAADRMIGDFGHKTKICMCVYVSCEVLRACDCVR